MLIQLPRLYNHLLPAPRAWWRLLRKYNGDIFSEFTSTYLIGNIEN